jgi:hypothetical protein
MSGKDETVAEIKRMTESIGYGHWRLPATEGVDWEAAAKQVGGAIQGLRGSLRHINAKDAAAAHDLIESVEAQIAKVKTDLGM